MRYPLNNWKSLPRGYAFGVKTFYNEFHLGLDLIVPTGTPIYAPTDGKVVNHLNGKEGGLTVWFRMRGGKLVRFLHLSRFEGGLGPRKEGDVVGYVGSTGLSIGPHLHTDTSKDGQLRLSDRNNFEDPEVTFAAADRRRVDDHYGQRRSTAKELAMKFNPWLIRRIGRLPAWHEVSALVYGCWDFEAVYRNRVGDTWLDKTKPEAT